MSIKYIKEEYILIDDIEYRVGDKIKVEYIWEIIRTKTKQIEESKIINGKIIEIQGHKLIIDASTEMESNIVQIVYNYIKNIEMI